MQTSYVKETNVFLDLCVCQCVCIYSLTLSHIYVYADILIPVHIHMCLCDYAHRCTYSHAYAHILQRTNIPPTHEHRKYFCQCYRLVVLRYLVGYLQYSFTLCSQRKSIWLLKIKCVLKVIAFIKYLVLCLHCIIQ